MKIVIIEDEKPATEKLMRFIERYDHSFEIIKTLTSVQEAVAYFKYGKDEADLIFMDIQIKDGKSFDILSETTIEKPVIFTTAYDEYAIEAFKLNSIAYLLKPYTFDEFTQALNKLKKLKQGLKPELNLQSITEVISRLNNKTYKDRFMVKLGDHLRSLKINEIAYFFADGRTVYLVTKENRKFIIDYRLEELEELLDPALFFRANRSFILHIDAIDDASAYTNSRLKITASPEINKEIIVSRERVNDFKNWFSGH